MSIQSGYNMNSKILKKIFPFLNWGQLVTKESLQADFIAGVTVALVLIPQSMAYAQLAGLPAVYGLYAALLPGLIGALWGSSYHLGTGPVAMTSLLTMATLLQFSQDAEGFIGSERYIELAILLALIVGIIRILIGVFKLTFFVNFLSQPVVRGFINAGALIIASSQISKIFGIKMPSSDFYLRDLIEVHINIPSQLHNKTFIIGVLSLVILWFLKKYLPKVPSALVVVALGSLAVKYLNLADPRVIDANFTGIIPDGKTFVSVVGVIPAGLPKIQMPTMNTELILKMIPGAFVVMFIGFMEVTSVIKAISPKSKQKVDLDQELIGQGVSAVVGSFSGCYPTSGSFSRTALNFASGGKTGISNVFAAAMVLIALLFLTPYLVYLPQAVLAAIIIMAVIGLLDFKAMNHAWKVNKHDGIASWVTFTTSILFAPNIVNGIILGGILALVLHLYRTMSPQVSVISDPPSDGKTININPEEQYPRMGFDGRLYFANTAFFEETIMKVIETHPKIKKILVMCEGINGLDASGESMLRELIGNLREVGQDIVFIGLKPQVIEIMQRADLYSFIGNGNIFKDEKTFKESLGRLTNKNVLKSVVKKSIAKKALSRKKS